MPVTFSPPLADARPYPQVRFKMIPQIRGAEHIGSRPTPKNVSRVLGFGQARSALAFIAEYELGAGSKVFLPAYHCPSLVEPFLWAGCRVDFYPLNPDLTPRLEMLDAATEDKAACVLVRYFGHDCNALSSTKLLKSLGYTVVEDLAHAAHITELYGDYGVTSLRKFYPVSTGAELFLSSSVKNPANIEKLVNRRLASSWSWKIIDCKARVRERFFRPPYSRFRYLKESQLRQPTSRRDIAELAKHDHNKLAETRRENYISLINFFSGSNIGDPLFPDISRFKAPYVFPLLLEHCSTFDLLKNSGIPLYRWEELVPTSCITSKRYRSKLIQIPCHQDLRISDLDYLMSVCKSIEESI